MIAVTNWRDFGAALVVLAIGVVFLFWTLTIAPRAAAMPMLVAGLTIVLASIDVVSRTETSVGRTLRRYVSAQNIIEWKPQGDGDEAGWGRVLMSIFWVFAYLAGMSLFGLLLTTPVYVAFYMLLHGRKSLRASLIAAAITTFGIWFTFEILFRYPLYPGMLFGGD